MPVMVSSTVSPSFSQAGGSMPSATPEGVPDTDWLAFEQDKQQHLLTTSRKD